MARGLASFVLAAALAHAATWCTLDGWVYRPRDAGSADGGARDGGPEDGGGPQDGGSQDGGSQDGGTPSLIVLHGTFVGGAVRGRSSAGPIELHGAFTWLGAIRGERDGITLEGWLG